MTKKDHMTGGTIPPGQPQGFQALKHIYLTTQCLVHHSQAHMLLQLVCDAELSAL